ncbi:MAG TPA: LysR family transcriptional regulator [Burkholderiales bacterium]|jgi:DNA-binding transcriptional LysR family regulator
MPHDLDLRLLRAFVMVAERGGFSAAARALHITQPALSRRIAELEATLGVRLFERTSRHVELTENGRDLVARSHDLLRGGEALYEHSRALANGKAGLLLVGCAPMIMESVVAPFITRYRKRYADVEVQLHEQGGERALQAVLRGELHAAVASPMEPRLESRLLFPWRLLAVVPSGHHIADGRIVDLARLADEQILTLPAGFGTRALFDAGCETIGVRPKIRMEASAAQTLVAAARSGYGVAVVPSVLIINKRGVAALPIAVAGKPLGRWLAINWHEKRCPPYLERLSEMLATSLSRQHPGVQYGYVSDADVPKPRGGRARRNAAKEFGL